MRDQLRILFLCTGNSCRSQMAEGLCRHFHGEEMEARSAGIETHGLNPRAVHVMAEIGIDISGHRSTTIADLGDQVFDHVVTVCDHADRHCPVFPARTSVIHRDFDDPPVLASHATDEEEALGHYRRVRDQIKEFVLTLPGSLRSDTSGRQD